MWVRWDPQILARMARTRSMPVVGAPHILKCSSSCHLWSCLGNHKVIREPKPPIKSWLYCNPFMVVYGMRLIRRPWKACQFWDVTFTIPWKGCKFQKWGLRKWGYRIWFFWVFNMLHMLSYDHQGGGGGWGVRGVYERSWRALPLRCGRCTRCACCRMIIRGGWGWRGALASSIPARASFQDSFTPFWLTAYASRCGVYRITLYLSLEPWQAYIKGAQYSCSVHVGFKPK